MPMLNDTRSTLPVSVERLHILLDGMALLCVGRLVVGGSTQPHPPHLNLWGTLQIVWGCKVEMQLWILMFVYSELSQVQWLAVVLWAPLARVVCEYKQKAHLVHPIIIFRSWCKYCGKSHGYKSAVKLNGSRDGDVSKCMSSLVALPNFNVNPPVNYF